MEIKTLSGQEICDIIKVCHESGVSDLSFGGLVVSFHPRRNEGAAMPGQASELAVENFPPPVIADISSHSEKLDIKFMDEDAMDEAEEAQLLSEDPRGFENVQLSRHIEKHRLMNETTQTR